MGSALSTMRVDGSRVKLHPLLVPGRWLTRRRALFAALIAFYVLAPFGSISGHPLLFLDVEHRRFWLLGQSFNAQDVWLVVFLALAFGFGLLFVTAWKGRVWCGWACPQTVFLEGVFRPIERLFEGPPERRQKLQNAPWSIGKVARVGGKQLTFFVMATAIAHAAAAILVSPKEFLGIVLDGPALHVEAFTLVTGFSAVLWFNFGWFREQFCVVVCPYGRLQSVLHDADTVTVAYDVRRGEPRGKLAKVASAAPRGDCVDCNKCVQTCPTGIDIRNGLQMECIACVQCVDACDDVMRKVHKPEGLIRFASQRELSPAPRRTLRPRLAIYAAACLLSSGALAAGLALRSPFEANVLRPRGSNPFVVDGDVVHNTFEVHLVNKHSEAATFRLSVVSSNAASKVSIGTPQVSLPSLGDARVPLSISIARADLSAPVQLTLEVVDETSGEVKRTPLRFLGPAAQGR